MPLRVAAISFLNPAPLLYNFEHEPSATRLRERYERHYTSPAVCAAELLKGTADVGLVPIASLTPELAIVPGCTIASLGQVRSILLLVKNPRHLPVKESLKNVSLVAVDTASRSSTTYLQVLFEHFYGSHPSFVEYSADPSAMLADADAALLIGDPALLARERPAKIEEAVGESLLWLDVAQLWREQTALPWVAAVWAVRPEMLVSAGLSSRELISDLTASRDAGLAHIEQLVEEWSLRIALPAEIIHAYLTRNIHYILDEECLRTIRFFRKFAAELGVLAPLDELNVLRA